MLNDIKIISNGQSLAKDLRRGQRIVLKVNTPDGPMTIYPVVGRVLMHPSNMERVRVHCREESKNMLPAIRCVRDFGVEDVVDLVR